MSLDDIDTAYEFEGRFVKSEKLVLVTVFVFGLIAFVALLVLLTANETTPQSTLALSGTAVFAGSVLSWITYRYYLYIQEVQSIRNRFIEIDNFLTEVIDGKASRRERLEMSTNIAALHNAMFQVMHEYLSEHNLESGGNTDCILLAKCFALFNMSMDEKQQLTALLKPD